MLNSKQALIIDIAGTSLTEQDRDCLSHPLVGGLILFSRNFVDYAQIKALVAEVKTLRPELVVAVDHEGGRVQRFKDGFTRIGPMADIGILYDKNSAEGKALAFDTGRTIAAELRKVDIDLSLSPLLDLNYGRNAAIGDRSFHAKPQAVADLGLAFMQGLHSAGMKAVAKHFPGHGYVTADSHDDIAHDSRDFNTIWGNDAYPFRVLVEHGLDAVMPSHIIYEQSDPNPAGFSSFWLKEVLQSRMHYNGLVVSDDLHMQGAATAGDMVGRVKAALQAGCDSLLICNDRPSVLAVLADLAVEGKARTQQLLAITSKVLRE